MNYLYRQEHVASPKHFVEHKEAKGKKKDQGSRKQPLASESPSSNHASCTCLNQFLSLWVSWFPHLYSGDKKPSL